MVGVFAFLIASPVLSWSGEIPQPSITIKQTELGVEVEVADMVDERMI